MNYSESQLFLPGLSYKPIIRVIICLVTYLFKEVTECKGDIQAVKSTPTPFQSKWGKTFHPPQNTNQDHCNTFGWGTILLSESIKIYQNVPVRFG